MLPFQTLLHRDVAKDSAAGLVRRLVPSEEWLERDFWRRAAVRAKAAGRRAVGVLLDDGEGDLDDWFTQKVRTSRVCHFKFLQTHQGRLVLGARVLRSL